MERLIITDAIRPHLEQISQRLWNNKAVVMVGAGFSKNASSSYPDWGQLGDKLYQLAHGRLPSEKDKSYLSLLKVAQEAEAIVGRPEINSLIQAEVPNLDVAPSKLHTDLLQLPWNDVFTTNYDTLLERATDKVIKHRYSTVVNQNDLPYAEKPRIIKLHGSFNSDSPLVITEEDYRQYPKDRAPFVNTVQQALLENTLVLIGFSGDDPNFLHWIGWIRDHLGNEHTQPIYLITASQFSRAQANLLEKRNIHVVDMSLCTAVASDDHGGGLQQFLNFINLRNPNRLDWPELEYSGESALNSPSRVIELHDLNEAIKEWAIQRNRYPGWLIVPHNNRNKLYYGTKDWIVFNASDHKKLFDSISDGTDIFFIFEMVWRLELCLLPVYDNIAELAQFLLDKYCPFSEITDSTSNSVNINDVNHSQLHWKKIRSVWLSIAISMLRYYREEGKEIEWNSAKLLLDKLKKYLSDEQKEQIQHQTYLFELSKLNVSFARQLLKRWQPKSSQPYWRYIHITAQMELDQLEDPSLLIDECLIETRKQSQSGNNSFPYLASSQESYQMLMHRWAKRNIWEAHPASDTEKDEMETEFKRTWKPRNQVIITSKSSDVNRESLFSNVEEDWDDLESKHSGEREKEWNELLRVVRANNERIENALYNARFDKLKADRIDPFAEISYLELSIKQNNNLKKTQVFDIGRKSTGSTRFAEDPKYRHAFSFLRFHEEAGIPLRFGYSAFAKESATWAIEHLAKSAPHRVTATLFRLGDVKAVDTLFNRESIWGMSIDDVDESVSKYLKVLADCKKKLKVKQFDIQYSFEYRLAQILPEILSRLCCKCSLSSKEYLWEFIIERYETSNKNNYENIANLTRRLINSLSNREKMAWIPRLLSLPIPTVLNHSTKREYLNPFLYVNIDTANLSDLADIKIQSKHFHTLIIDAECYDADRRKWALISLNTLHKLKLLTPDQLEKFGVALWAKLGGDGFPENTEDYYRFALLDSPSPEKINSADLVKAHIKDQKFPIQKESKDEGYQLTGGRIDLAHNIIGASNKTHNIWGHKDAVFWTNRIVKWWDADKERLIKERDKTSSNQIFGNGKEFHARLQRINELTATAIIPNLKHPLKNSKVLADITRLLNEMRVEGLDILQAEAEWLRFKPSIEKSLFEHVESAIVSQNENLEQDALMAILNILLGSHTDKQKSLASKMLAQFIKWCRTVKISQALWIVIILLRERPEEYSSILKAAINSRLEKLINETNYSVKNILFEFDDKLTIRKAAMCLAAELKKYYIPSKVTVPNVINEWEIISASQQEFAEIKNTWIDNVK